MRTSSSTSSTNTIRAKNELRLSSAALCRSSFAAAVASATTYALDQVYEPEMADHRSGIYELGTHHFSFWVNDIDGVIQRARDGGYDVIEPHTAPSSEYAEEPGSEIRSVFLHDPDGNLVQCDERVVPA